MSELFLPILILVSIVNTLVGLLLFLNPALAIGVQKKFYEKINWCIEPISMSKELRNTKIMGLLIIAIVILTFIYIFISIKIT